MTESVIGKSIEVVPIERHLACARGEFLNPIEGYPEIRMPLVVRKKEGENGKFKDVHTMKTLAMAMTNPMLVIPYVDTDFNPLQTHDENGVLIPGNSFLAIHLRNQLFSLLRFMVDKEIENGTIMDNVSDNATVELQKVLQAMGVNV